MVRIWQRLAVLALCLGVFTPGVLLAQGETTATPNTSLTIAVTPYYSTALMFQQYEPMRKFLQDHLGRPVYLETATNFETFARNTQKHRYRFIFDVPHFGRMAEVDEGYRPLMQMKAALRGRFLVAAGSPIATLGDLRGKTIAAPDPLAIIPMMGKELLAENGIDPDHDVRIVAKPTHNAAVLSVLNGDSDAAIVWFRTVDSMPEGTTEQLKTIADTEDINAFILVMAAPDVPEVEEQNVHAALSAFAESDEGKAFAKATGYGHLVPVTSDELRPLDRYLPAVRRALATPTH